MQRGQGVDSLDEHGTKLPHHALNSMSKTGKYLGTQYVFGTNLFSLTKMYCMFLYLDCILCEISNLKCMQCRTCCATWALVISPLAAAEPKQGLEQAADRP